MGSRVFRGSSGGSILNRNHCTGLDRNPRTGLRGVGRGWGAGSAGGCTHKMVVAGRKKKEHTGVVGSAVASSN